MRERTEDLGRLLIMIKHVLNKSLFTEELNKYTCVEYLFPVDLLEKDEDGVYEIYLERINNLRIEMEEVRSMLTDCLEICEGNDYLNYLESKK